MIRQTVSRAVTRVVGLVCVLLCAACGGDATCTPQTSPTAPLVAAQTQSSELYPTAPGDLVVESIYNNDLVFQPADRIVISELDLLLEAVQLLVSTDWDGADAPLPLSIADFDQEKLEAYIADEINDAQELTIPQNLYDLYLSPEAASEMTNLLVQARDEYVAYLEAKGTLPQYIAEINERVLPPDSSRLVYHPDNDPHSPPSCTEGRVLESGEKDHSQLQMQIYPVDIYNRALMLQESSVVGQEPDEPAARRAYQRLLRDMATRQLVYHEMTHVVQRAYVNLHVSEQDRSQKIAWFFASKTLIEIDTQYHWRWGDRIFADSNNRHVSDESQAEGISFEVFTAVYNASPQQKKAVWDYFFGRLENSRETLDQIRVLFETHYPDFSPDEFGNLLYDVTQTYPDQEKRYVLNRLALKLSGMPAYVGYLNPMQPQDCEKFWQALRQP